MKQFIQLQHVSFAYEKQLVLNQINASFEKGKLSVILGRNGSGKSTMFNILAGLEKKYEGQVFFDGIERKGSRHPIRLGFLNQFHQTTFPFTVREVILTGRASFSSFKPSAEDHREVEEIVARFQLTYLIDKPYTALSGGERQLVLLCRVLVQKPAVLMLDEPTNHLDLHYQVAVLKCIKQLANEGTTILCVMHDPNLAFMFGDRFYLMQNNQLIDIQSLENKEVHQLLEETYQLPLHPLDNQGKLMFMPLIEV
jgi:iron complex transport system ATP-binding protein